MNRPKILIVDDDENISELISLYLEKECFDTETAENGEAALTLVDVYNPDLILLDLMLPGIDGYEVCQQIRKTRDTPIIILSAKGEVFDKVLGLKMGADDYIIKPFSLAALFAKVQTMLKRAKGTVCNNILKCGAIRIDLVTMTVTADGSPVTLAPKEYELLRCLLENKAQVLSRDQLLDRVWGTDYFGADRVVDNHIKKLRHALGNAGRQIRTVFTKGYQLTE